MVRRKEIISDQGSFFCSVQAPKNVSPEQHPTKQTGFMEPNSLDWQSSHMWQRTRILWDSEREPKSWIESLLGHSLGQQWVEARHKSLEVLK